MQIEAMWHNTPQSKYSVNGTERRYDQLQCARWVPCHTLSLEGETHDLQERRHLIRETVNEAVKSQGKGLKVWQSSFCQRNSGKDER